MTSEPTRSNPLTTAGGAGCGVVFISRHIEPTDGFRLRLRCVRGTEHGKNNTVHALSSDDTKWNNVQARLHGREKAVTLSGGLTSRCVEPMWINDLESRAGLTGSGPAGER